MAMATQHAKHMVTSKYRSGLFMTEILSLRNDAMLLDAGFSDRLLLHGKDGNAWKQFTVSGIRYLDKVHRLA